MNLFFFQRYSKNWILLTTTQRIEPFFFIIWLWALNPFINTTQKLTRKIWLVILFLNMTQKFFFFEFDSTNWIFFPYYSKHSTFVFEMTLRTELFFVMTQRNWTFFFFCIWLKELNFFIWFKELNFFQFQLKELNFFAIWPKQLNLFFQTQRIEIFSVWHAELNLFKNTTHRIEHFFQNDSQNWTFFFWIRLTEMALFLEYDAKIWAPYFLNMTQWNLFFLLNMTQRIVNLFSFLVTQRIEFFWRTLRTLLFFSNVTQNDFFWTLLVELNPF